MDQRRLESYFRWFRMKVTTTVSFLAWTGIIISVLAIIAGILTAVLLNREMDSNAKILRYVPIIISPLSPYPLYELLPLPNIPLLSLPNIPRTIPGVIILFIILLLISILLLKKNSIGNCCGVIRIICKFFLSIHLIASIFIFITLIVGLIFSVPISFYQLFYTIHVSSICIVGFMSIIFVCIAINGVWNNRKMPIGSYIIFNIGVVMIEIARFIFTIYVLSYIIFQMSLTFGILGIILYIVYSFYYIRFFVVFCNIVDVNLDNDQEMKPLIVNEVYEYYEV